MLLISILDKEAKDTFERTMTKCPTLTKVCGSTRNQQQQNTTLAQQARIQQEHFMFGNTHACILPTLSDMKFTQF